MPINSQWMWSAGLQRTWTLHQWKVLVCSRLHGSLLRRSRLSASNVHQSRLLRRRNLHLQERLDRLGLLVGRQGGDSMLTYLFQPRQVRSTLPEMHLRSEVQRRWLLDGALRLELRLARSMRRWQVSVRWWLGWWAVQCKTVRSAMQRSWSVQERNLLVRHWMEWKTLHARRLSRRVSCTMVDDCWNKFKIDLFHRCSSHGQCRVGGEGLFECRCNDGWDGADCSIPLEKDCKDGKDNDKGKKFIWPRGKQLS